MSLRTGGKTAGFGGRTKTASDVYHLPGEKFIEVRLTLFSRT
jgi:hypothetical protein